MSESIDDLTIEYTEDGVLLTKQLDKIILSKGAWVTIIFRYQTWDNKKQDYGPEAYTIRRYRKRDGKYQQQSRFNISSKDQAQKIIDALSTWINKE